MPPSLWTRGALLVAIASCSDKRAPAPKPTPPATEAPAPVTRGGGGGGGRYYVPTKACNAAIDDWLKIPASGDFGVDQRRLFAIRDQLGGPGFQYKCDLARLAKVIPVAIGFLEDTRVFSDERGGDGSLIQLRHEAKYILENLTGQSFGAFHTLSVGFTRTGGGQHETPEDPKAVPGWKSWWAATSANLSALTDTWERTRDELAVKSYAPAVAQLRGKRLYAPQVWKVKPFKDGLTVSDLWDYGWMSRDGKLVHATQQGSEVVIESARIVERLDQAQYPATAVVRWRYGAEAPLAELMNKDVAIPDRLLADVEAQEPALFQVLLATNFLSLYAVDGDDVAQLMLK